MKKKCIVIGGGGFLGLNIARGLLSLQHEVSIVDINLPTTSIFNEIKSDVFYYQEDYRNLGKIEKILDGQELLFHFACTSLPASPLDKLEEDVEDSVVNPLRLFKLAIKKGIKKIIFPSSGGTVYGNLDKIPIKEDYPTKPICYYGITKLMFEKYLFLLHNIYGIDYLVYRISNSYGPGQSPNRPQGLVANVIAKMLTNSDIPIFGDGKNIRDYVFIEDVVSAFMMGIEKDLKNNVFNVATGKGTSTKEIINIASRVIGITPKVHFCDARPIDARVNILSIDKIKSALNWEPKVDIENGVRLAFDWIKNNFF